MPLTSSTLARLDRATRSHHIEADSPWLGLMDGEVRRERYLRQLAIAYGFEAPLESAFAYTTGLVGIVNVRARVRSGLLAQDLLALGLLPAQLAALPQCFSITPFDEITDALGWMYVVERATLLHDSVRRHLLRFLPEAPLATSYLAAAGTGAAARWQALGKALDLYAADSTISDRIASAADHAFRSWRDWVHRNHGAHDEA